MYLIENDGGGQQIQLQYVVIRELDDRVTIGGREFPGMFLKGVLGSHLVRKGGSF